MRKHPAGSTPAEANLFQAARRARSLFASFQTCIAALIVFGIAMLLRNLLYQRAGFTLFDLLILPLFAASAGWVFVELARSHALCSKLHRLFENESDDLYQSVSTAAIGPLLDMMAGGGMNIHFFRAPVALLGDLLTAVRPEDGVVLTTSQRRLLHTLVMKGFWNTTTIPTWVLADGVEQELRAAAVGALAVLGNSASAAMLEQFARQTGDSELRQAAIRSVARIRERSKYGPEEMLRASRAPHRPETLLRPASGSTPQNEDPGQLLRMGQPGASVSEERTAPGAAEQLGTVASAVTLPTDSR